MEKEYTYGVARIRALEASLFDETMTEQLLACRTYEECVAFLRDNGWGNGTADESPEEIFKEERAKTDRVLFDLVEDSDTLAILSVETDFHNLKAAIKTACTAGSAGAVFIGLDDEEADRLTSIISSKEFDMLPSNMAHAAAEATDVLLKSGDGRRCDIIIDNAALLAISEAGEKSDSKFVSDYADAYITITNIKTAARCARTGKDARFTESAMVSCGGINIKELAAAAENGLDALCGLLEERGYRAEAEALKKSSSVFECECDNRLMDIIRTQKYESFTAGPIIAYALARRSEIKTAKIILQGKQNGFDDDFIRERIRKTYV